MQKETCKRANGSFIFNREKYPSCYEEIRWRRGKMDEMKIKLSTKLMKGLVAKIIAKAISKQLGCKADIQLNEIEVAMYGDNIHFHINADGKLNGVQITKISKMIDEDE